MLMTMMITIMLSYDDDDDYNDDNIMQLLTPGN